MGITGCCLLRRRARLDEFEKDEWGQEGRIIQQRVRIESTFTVFRVKWSEGECFSALSLKESQEVTFVRYSDI